MNDKEIANKCASVTTQLDDMIQTLAKVKGNPYATAVEDLCRLNNSIHLLTEGLGNAMLNQPGDSPDLQEAKRIAYEQVSAKGMQLVASFVQHLAMEEALAQILADIIKNKVIPDRWDNLIRDQFKISVDNMRTDVKTLLKKMDEFPELKIL